MRKDNESKAQQDKSTKCSEIKKQIINLQEELKKLQEECNHSEKMLKFGDRNTVFKYCKTCYKQIGYPNETELRDNGFK